MKAARLGLVALGIAAMAYAGWSALHSPGLVPSRNTTFLLLVLVLHDGLLMPAFVAVGVLVHRLVPRRVRAVVQAALIATASVTLVALPLALGYGRIADNPSALPRDYPGGLLLTVATIWAAAAVAATVTVRRHPRGHPPPGGPAALEFRRVSGRRHAR